jgi:uncharacterized protein YdiU (UPF0061 family)
LVGSYNQIGLLILQIAKTAGIVLGTNPKLHFGTSSIGHLYPLKSCPLESILNSFQTDYEADYASMMRNKLGLYEKENDKSDSFIDRKFAWDRNGYDHFFRKLSQIKK